MSSPFTLQLLLGLLRAAPTVAQDIEAAVKAAESPEDASQKIHDVLGDLEKAIQALTTIL